MFYIAVYESRPELRKMIHKCLEAYSFGTNLVKDIIWMETLPSEEKQDIYFPDVRIGLLSLDMPNGKDVAEALYQRNPDCRIVFISEAVQDLVPLLHIRPIGFYRLQDESMNAKEITRKIESVISDLQSTSDMLSVENRYGLYLLPASEILYFQSDLKNVCIYCVGLEPITISRKLSQVQKLIADKGLGAQFIRTHQSYIVSKKHIRRLNKQTHMLSMSSGESLPVSASRYDAVLHALKVNEKEKMIFKH